MTAISNRTALQPNVSVDALAGELEEVAISPKPKKHKDEVVNKDYAVILDNSKKKLSSLDTQRIVAVLDDTIRKAEIATLLPYIAENIERYSIMLGNELVFLIQEYDQLQTELTRAVSRMRKSRPNSAAESEDQREDENAYELMKYRLVSCVKSILRMFRSNPTALNAIRVERKERTFEANNLVDHLSSMKEQVFSRLVTTPGEEKEKQRTIIQILAREKKAMAQIKKLESELAIETAANDKEIEAKNDILLKLKTSIQSVEQESDSLNRKLVMDANKMESLELKNSEARSGRLQQELINLKQQLQTSLNGHKEGELSLRKRKFKIETEVENWIMKFDGDMGEKQDEIDELTIIYTDEKKQLEQLEERFSVLEEEYTAIMEERRIARERKEEQERELQVLVKAATLLQAFWRAYKCRKELKLRQKKGAKKKSSKKKKK